MMSVRWTLLALLLPALVVLMAGELWLSYRELRTAGNAAYGRSLAGAIKGIDARVSTDSGGLSVELPYQTLEFFQLVANGRVFYRITTNDGLVTLGNADLPEPKVRLRLGVPHFYDAEYFGEPIRVGAYERRLDKPLYGAQAQNLIILVAETTDARASFVKGLLRQAAGLDALLVLVIATLMTAAVVLALRPLLRVRAEVLARAEDDLAPMDPSRVPQEIRPLVEAVNQHIAKWTRLAAGQKQFLEDASHQLRTPLAVLRTQIEYARREPELGKVRDALTAMQGGIERSTRMVNQLLALARVSNEMAWAESTETVALSRMAHGVARSLLQEARRKRQDFVFLEPAQEVFVDGTEVLLREAVMNLVDNAIKYTPEGGHITLAVDARGGDARVAVSDDGPGIEDLAPARIGERFRRGRSAPAGGAGLGLAIAKAIMERHAGRLEVEGHAPAPGLTARLVLPAHQTAHQPAAEAAAALPAAATWGSK